MPVYLWGDEDGSRYRAAYFEHYPGIWRHGDWIEITPRGTAIIYGRSDSTINRSGIRMGTSEIYRAVQAVPEIVDALVVDVPREGTEGWMPLFVVLRDGATLDSDLEREIARRIREQCSPRHVPDRVFEVAGGAADPERQGARGPGEADPHGHARRAGGEPRLARQPRLARLLHGAGGPAPRDGEAARGVSRGAALPRPARLARCAGSSTA